MINLNDKLLTESESAELLRTNKSTIRYWRQLGKLQSVKVGRHPLIRESEISRFLSKCEDSSKANINPCDKMHSVGNKAGGIL